MGKNSAIVFFYIGTTKKFIVLQINLTNVAIMIKLAGGLIL